MALFQRLPGCMGTYRGSSGLPWWVFWGISDRVVESITSKSTKISWKYEDDSLCTYLGVWYICNVIYIYIYVNVDCKTHVFLCMLYPSLSKLSRLWPLTGESWPRWCRWRNGLCWSICTARGAAPSFLLPNGVNIAKDFHSWGCCELLISLWNFWWKL